jgi:hypothetical protein
MARTPEAKVKQKCIETIKKYGAYYFMPPANGYGRGGIPDIVGCFRGYFFGVECKAGYNKTTPIQDRELAAIQQARGAAFVIREDTVDLLEQWLLEKARGP